VKSSEDAAGFVCSGLVAPRRLVRRFVMSQCVRLSAAIAVSALLVGGLVALAQNKKESEDQERKIKESEVPKAALEALKKLAGSATMTEFAEEVEHGQKLYEASWKGPDGNVDALVTATGDLVEIEEVVSSDRVPAAVRTAVELDAGKDAQVKFEKKTYVVYEAKFKRDGKTCELLLKPNGRRHREENENNGEEQEGEHEDDD